MKKQYEHAELEIIIFNVCDIITTSNPLIESDGDSGSGIGGGYNPDGWS